MSQVIEDLFLFTNNFSEQDRKPWEIIKGFFIELGDERALKFKTYLNVTILEKDFHKLSERLDTFCKNKNIEFMDAELFILHRSIADSSLRTGTIENPNKINAAEFIEEIQAANRYWKDYASGHYYTYEVSDYAQEILDNREYYQDLHQKLLDRLRPPANIKPRNKIPTKEHTKDSATYDSLFTEESIKAKNRLKYCQNFEKNP